MVLPHVKAAPVILSTLVGKTVSDGCSWCQRGAKSGIGMDGMGLGRVTLCLKREGKSHLVKARDHF